MKKTVVLLTIAVCAVFLAGCPVPPVDAPDDGDDDNGVVQVDDLFVDQGSGKYDFQTNNTEYWGPYGFTLWALKGPVQAPFDHREVTLNKVAGNSTAGYGIVFCQYNTGDPGVGETMLVVMINTEKEYTVGEVCGVQFEYLIPWTTSNALTAGYNQANVVRLEYTPDVSGPSGVFNLYINDVFVEDFRDQETPYHTQGADGFIVVISPEDDFPSVPVHAIFQEQ